MGPTNRRPHAPKKKIEITFSYLLNVAKSLLFEYKYFWAVVSALLIAEIAVNVLVIWKINYTEIDWQAYMMEVEGFLNGTYDYTKLEGGTGPLVYPAGFVYLFSGLYFFTNQGTNIQLAQYIYAALYIFMLCSIFYIYNKSQRAPPYVMFFICCASYRIHSIFVLRLFNDPIAMIFLYVAVMLFINDYWSSGCVFFSLGVSIKMNVLLFAPGLGILLLVRFGVIGTIWRIVMCGIIQLVLGLPFLLENWIGYVSRSFNLGRQFFYIWTVNWRLIPEWLFLSRRFHVLLLLLHLAFLIYFAFKKFPIPQNGWLSLMKNFIPRKLSTNEIVYSLFVSNFIGMCFSRSLHYQFYVWYFHTLPFLLWSVKLPAMFRLLVLGLLEMAWNTYPSTVLSSSMLHICHLIILLGLLFRDTQQSKLINDNKKD